ncbi:MAG: DUF5906 domain-containing protein [Leadbetterella sp.]|nr:DUF5906 domain-containing protein [Leadbetterella sp.]
MINKQDIDNIPQQLRSYPHWVCYKPIDKGEPKLAKMPYDPKTGRPAKANDPKTWGTFEQACKVAKNGKYDGIGFEFFDDDPFTGVDLDHCVQNGVILPWAQAIINRLNSYSELSPSETGVHIYLEAIKPKGRCRKGDIEIYVSGRFLTITGNRLDNTPLTIEKRQEELDKIHAEVFGNHSSKPTSKANQEPATTLSLSDGELINKAMSARNGAKFKALWNGDKSGYGNDDSAADIALCEMLAFWTGKDHNRVDSLFRQSGLYQDPERVKKWNERRGEQTYGDLTISNAIKGCVNVYQGKKGKPLPKDQTRKSGKENTTPNPADEKLIDELNKKHAVLWLGGKCSVLNETYNYELNRPDISFSNPIDIKNFYANILTSDGVKLGKKWFEHPRRRQYDGIVFAPLQNPPGHYNLWRGFAVEPKEGDYSLILDHARKNIARGNEKHYNYLIAWAADLVQNPCKRPGTSIVLRGKQGTGKGIWCSGLGSLFGPSHFIQVHHSRHLTGNFNSHLKGALLVFADESFWAGDKSAEGVLKAMITEEYMNIEPKGKDAFKIKNHIRLMIASNNNWVVPAGLEERRFFILDMGEDHIQDRKYFGKILDQMNNGGQEALLYYLQHYDLSNIDLGKIPQTEALLETKILTMNSIEQFVFHRLKEGKQTANTTEWDTANISKSEFYSEFISFCGKKSYVPSPIEFGIGIKKLIPKLIDKRPKINGERICCYSFPSLKECREYWEKITNSDGYKWDDEEEEEAPF